MDPVGPTGQTPTPHANGGAAINPPPQIPKTKIQTEAITQSARTMGTPPPPPVIKPRPTPTIVMKDGKIVQQWQAPPEAASVANPFKGQAEAVKLGREYYMQRCEACHGKEGNGNGWMSSSIAKPPTNLTSTMVQANTDGELFWKITHGRSPMPANHVRFTDEQRWQIVTFLRTLK
jgi:mono/diheme cytochrome c family protein